MVPATMELVGQAVMVAVGAWFTATAMVLDTGELKFTPSLVRRRSW